MWICPHFHNTTIETLKRLAEERMNPVLRLLLLSTSICYVVLMIKHANITAERTKQLYPAPRTLQYFSVSTEATKLYHNNSLTETTKKVTLKPLGEAHSYEDEVNLRVIVLTFNRPSSLQKCLQHIQRLDMDGGSLAVEIWVDRSTKGRVDNQTVTIAREAEEKWKNGRVKVHIRENNAGIVDQWVNTWRPMENSTEIGLIIEDDIDVAPVAYRWLRAVHDKFRGHANFSGATLQTQGAKFKAGRIRRLVANATERAFLYGVTGTWGFSPNPIAWRKFQDWVKVAREQGVKPYIKGLLSTRWYQMSEKKGKADSVWAVWYHYFSYVKHLYCLYSNLEAFTRKGNVLLSWNRQEKGLHYGGGMSLKSTKRLLSKWSEDLVNFPNTTLQLSFNGLNSSRV